MTYQYNKKYLRSVVNGLDIESYVKHVVEIGLYKSQREFFETALYNMAMQHDEIRDLKDRNESLLEAWKLRGKPEASENKDVL